MYTKYVYNAGATQAQVLADIQAVLTGETNKANLSAGCDKTNTLIQATIAAGWTTYDANAGSGSVVIKAPLADDAATFKYVRLYVPNATTFRKTVYETWNASTHAGTNMVYYSDQDAYNQRLDLTNGGTMHIFSSARFLMLASETSGGWASSSYNGPDGCFERTRLLPFDTIAYGMPPFIWANLGYASIGTGYGGYAPRITDRVLSSSTASTADVYFWAAGYSSITYSAPSGADQKVPDGSGGFLLPFIPLYIGNVNKMPVAYGEISSLCDIWKITSGITNNKDVIQKNSIDYMVLRTNTTTSFIVARKG